MDNHIRSTYYRHLETKRKRQQLIKRIAFWVLAGSLLWMALLKVGI